MLRSKVFLSPFPSLVCRILVMDQNLDNKSLDENNVRIKPPKVVAKRGQDKMSNTCNQCDFATSYASSLRAHLKAHSGENTKKCNQCDYASSESGNMMRHLKTHSGEKSYKRNQCHPHKTKQE